MNWKEEQRLTEILEPYKVKCSCGHTVVITNKYRRKICNWCGKMNYLHEEDKKRNDFKLEMRKILNGTNIY